MVMQPRNPLTTFAHTNFALHDRHLLCSRHLQMTRSYKTSTTFPIRQPSRSDNLPDWTRSSSVPPALTFPLFRTRQPRFDFFPRARTQPNQHLYPTPFSIDAFAFTGRFIHMIPTLHYWNLIFAGEFSEGWMDNGWRKSILHVYDYDPNFITGRS